MLKPTHVWSDIFYGWHFQAHKLGDIIIDIDLDTLDVKTVSEVCPEVIQTWSETHKIELFFWIFLYTSISCFYRAMLRRVAVYVRLSVCLSMTLRYHDHIGWKSLKIISRLVSLGCSLSTDLNTTDLLQREHPKILAKVTHPLLNWASQIFYGKLRLNG